MAAKKKPTLEGADIKKPGAAESGKKVKSSLKYPPYVNGYGAIPKLFSEIKKASVPPKFTQDFMETVLEFKSSSHRALIPLLKKLGFIDAANVPTETYKAYRDDAQSGAVMAAQVKTAYSDIYKANEYAHNLSKNDLQSKIRALVGASEEDANISAVVGTFSELTKLADFKLPAGNGDRKNTDGDTDKDSDDSPGGSGGIKVPSIGLSYTINLNLPATTEIEVFNSIFKSLKEHLLDG